MNFGCAVWLTVLRTHPLKSDAVAEGEGVTGTVGGEGIAAVEAATGTVGGEGIAAVGRNGCGIIASVGAVQTRLPWQVQHFWSMGH